MELLSRDPALRAALFRLVDVAPACADRRDLAAHLASLLGEVEGSVAPVGFARRVAMRRTSGPAVGAIAGLAVHRMATRFIVGADPADAVPALAAPVGARRGRVGGPARRGDHHRRRGRPLRPALRRRAPDAGARGPPVARPPHARRRSPGQPERQGHRAHRAGEGRGAGVRDRGRQGPAQDPPAHGEAGRRAPARRHGVDGLARPHHRTRDRAPERARVPRRPVGGHRAPGVPPRRRRAARPAPGRHPPPVHDPARQGRVLGARDGRGAPERVASARSTRPRWRATARSSASRAASSTLGRR